MMPMNPDIKPTCSGKLLSSQYTLSISMNHDISCSCCSNHIGSSIPIVHLELMKIIFPLMPAYDKPKVFQNSWSPQMMPMTNMTLNNDFNNFNLNAMGGGGGYPGM